MMVLTQNSAFSQAEYSDRLARFRVAMSSEGVDVAIVDDMETMIWLTGFRVTENLWRCLVVPAESAPFFVLRSLDAPQAAEKMPSFEIVKFCDHHDPVRVLTNSLESRDLANCAIGIDDDSYSLTRRRWMNLRSALPGTEFRDIGEAIYGLRQIKSSEEIGHLRKVASLTDQAFQVALRAVRRGGTQRDLAGAVAQAYYTLGFDDGYVGPITTGADWDSLHGFLSGRPLENGDIVHIELVPRLESYSARIMRSVFVGQPPRSLLDAMDRLTDAQDRQLEALRPGSIAADVDRIGRAAVLDARLRSTYDNVTGYTLGICPVGSPHTSDFRRCFTPSADWRIAEGMVFHMYLSGRGLAISETVLIERDRAVRLTQSERKLFQVI